MRRPPTLSMLVMPAGGRAVRGGNSCVAPQAEALAGRPAARGRPLVHRGGRGAPHLAEVHVSGPRDTAGGTTRRLPFEERALAAPA
ncbi:hypothetical protein [Nonomuraea dietziae]|uniref:hypothetical protein n=1 Tax=Nonomuraea dietziae TaxID=65515 RepID=UPI0031DBF7F7